MGLRKIDINIEVTVLPKLTTYYFILGLSKFDLKDDKPEQIKHELIQYSVRTINNSQVSRKTYPRKMHALYEKTSLYESDSAIFGAD